MKKHKLIVAIIMSSWVCFPLTVLRAGLVEDFLRSPYELNGLAPAVKPCLEYIIHRSDESTCNQFRVLIHNTFHDDQCRCDLKDLTLQEWEEGVNRAVSIIMIHGTVVDQYKLSEFIAKDILRTIQYQPLAFNIASKGFIREYYGLDDFEETLTSASARIKHCISKKDDALREAFKRFYRENLTDEKKRVQFAYYYGSFPGLQELERVFDLCLKDMKD